ncbi:cytochrome ubiquinol oxidase subunit I [Stackebrandtia nassauensis]|uniref:Cytochrome bd ubiquinol oxidase subunit I n=1 Tax=Stackebrandtia nassauensis (strain DSM 44728 / CIP 108903 / NRRL B-16338 / NBRC 102104 / LLR-40K-21) TaxID=446470 RepID=D3QB05_STANL|nr:cytochrome ubiquinol oxidase subunit I [Stackebrandtia nassauensis]ADD40822.1 cytochrome bd ubiquinol oxidase subunit I [Stackebrandtia nassauensis DSM 44728]
MDTLELARLQFATTTGIHWLFVMLTLGLVPLVAIVNTRAVFTRDADKREGLVRLAKFWGQLYVINYALGIVTGLVMEFQFGLSWSGLSEFAGNVFGAPLALETMIAFFAESTFLGMWIFGWDRLRLGTQAVLIWLVCLTAYASAFWILVANGFMQSPVGYEVREGRAYLTDFAAQLTNPNATVAFGHILTAALLTGGLFVAGVSAFHLLRRTREREFFRTGLRTGVIAAAASTFPVYMLGAAQFAVLADSQPMKLALLAGEGTSELQKDMVERHGPGDYVPPEWIETWLHTMANIGYLVSTLALCALLVLFRARFTRSRLLAIVMVLAVGGLFGLYLGSYLFDTPGPYNEIIMPACIALAAVVLGFGGRIRRWRGLGWLLVVAIPLPFVASVGGWLFREVGRQPWIVYGELKVSDAVSPVSFGHMLTSLVIFVGVLGALAVTNWTLIARFARRGPAASQLGVARDEVPVLETVGSSS